MYRVAPLFTAFVYNLLRFQELDGAARPLLEFELTSVHASPLVVSRGHTLDACSGTVCAVCGMETVEQCYGSLGLPDSPHARKPHYW